MSGLYRVIIYLILTCPFYTFAQNDSSCTVNNTHYLGLLPAPLACPSTGFSDSLSVSDNTLNYTAETGRPSLLSCKTPSSSVTYDMDPGSRDTWFIFVPTGNEVFIDIRPGGGTQLNAPVIGLYNYQGSCFNLIPLDCARGNAGRAHLQNGSLIPYQTYYIQVTGATPADAGNFVLTVKNRNTCLDCMQDSYLDMSPKPLNGFYPPGTQVTFTYTVHGYKPYAGNALQVVAPVFGSGWNTSSLTYIAPQSVSGNGSWTYGPYTVNGNNYYCFNFQNAINSGDAGNQASKWVFRWTMTTASNCTSSGYDLNISILNFSDKEVSGQNSVCSNDADYLFKSRINCCPAPVSSFISHPASCNNSCDADLILQTSGGNSYSVSIIDQHSGAGIAYAVPLNPGNPDSIHNLCAGQYDMIYVNTSAPGCLAQGHFQVNPPVIYTLDQVRQSCVGVCANEASLNIAGTSGNLQYHWLNVPTPNTSTSTYLTTLCHDSTYVIKFSSPGCLFYDSITVQGIPGDGAFVDYPPSMCNKSSITPYVFSPGGSFSSALQIGSDGTIDCTTGSPNNNLTGTYSIIYITNGSCPDTGYYSIDLVGQYNAYFSYPTTTFCKSDGSITPTGQTGGFYNYTPLYSGSPGLLNINPVTGTINPSVSDTGTYIVIYKTFPQGGTPTPCDTYYLDTIRINNNCDSTFHVFNTLTPNGDGKNDFLWINGIDGTENNVFIFNRWGVQVWERRNYNNEQNYWTGVDKNGKSLYEGTYYYLVEIKGRGRQKGWVELIR